MALAGNSTIVLVQDPEAFSDNSGLDVMFAGLAVRDALSSGPTLGAVSGSLQEKVVPEQVPPDCGLVGCPNIIPDAEPEAEGQVLVDMAIRAEGPDDPRRRFPHADRGQLPGDRKVGQIVRSAAWNRDGRGADDLRPVRGRYREPIRDAGRQPVDRGWFDQRRYGSAGRDTVPLLTTAGGPTCCMYDA